MTSYLLVCFKPRSIFLFLGVTLLAVGIFLGQGQELSWAAPEQNPYSQTVPPRPPTPTPPPSEPTPNGDRNDDSDDNGVSLPTEPPEQDNVVDEESNSSVQPPMQDDGANNDEVFPPTPSVEEGNNRDKVQTSSSIQPAELDDEEEEFPVVPQQADLSLSQGVDKAVANVGETLTFMIEVSNRGPDNATHVAVSNLLPAGLSLSEVTSSQGNFNHDQGLWTIAGITAGQTVSLSFEVTLTEAGLITNTTEIIAADQFDPDSTPGNGLTHEDDQASVLITVSAKPEQASQPHDNVAALTATAMPSSETPILSREMGLPFWFFGLIGGSALVLIGLFLVRRS